jgi:hypothetical protein
MPYGAARGGLFSALATLIAALEDRTAHRAGVIVWGCPVPTFGDLPRARVATLGLNPSNREFVDDQGKELRAEQRRFHTLRSLKLTSWSDANAGHLDNILAACCDYFRGNPYDRWFKRLDSVVSGTGSSFYDVERPACHLDIIPYATAQKWTKLSPGQRTDLLALSYDTLGLLLRNSSVRVLILNGQSVVMRFQEATGMALNSREVPDWSLPRKSGGYVRGVAYDGVVDALTGYRLRQELLVLGYNHNLQSSFGVTTAVIQSIRRWIAAEARGRFSERA